MLNAYPTHYISVEGKEVLCQILNWNGGSLPKYLICAPLDTQYHEEFLAKQRLGTWVKIRLSECEFLTPFRQLINSDDTVLWED